METYGQKPEKEDKNEEKKGQEHEEKKKSDGDSKDDHGEEQDTDEKQEKDEERENSGERKEEKGKETEGPLPERPMEPITVGRNQLMDFPDFGDEVKQDGRKIIVLDLRYLFGNHPLSVSPYYWTERYRY